MINIAGIGDSIMAAVSTPSGYQSSEPVDWTQSYLYILLQRLDPGQTITRGDYQGTITLTGRKWSTPNYTIYNAGKGGDTTTGMRTRFADDVVSQDPDFVMIAGGVNDISLGYNLVSTTEANLQWMCEQAIANNIIPVLCTLIPWNGGSSAQRNSVNTLNTWIRSYGAANDIDVIDFYPVMEDPAAGDQQTSPYLQNNNVHPTVAGYSLMGNAITLTDFVLTPTVGTQTVSLVGTDVQAQATITGLLVGDLIAYWYRDAAQAAPYTWYAFGTASQAGDVWTATVAKSSIGFDSAIAKCIVTRGASTYESSESDALSVWPAVVLGTPTITKSSETLTVDCSAANYTAAIDTLAFQYKVGSGDWVDMIAPSLVSGTTYRSTVPYAIATEDITARAKNTRWAVDALSSEAVFTVLPTASYRYRCIYPHTPSQLPVATYKHRALIPSLPLVQPLVATYRVRALMPAHPLAMVPVANYRVRAFYPESIDGTVLTLYAEKYILYLADNNKVLDLKR